MIPIPAKIAKNNHPRMQKKAIIDTIPETSTSKLVLLEVNALAALISISESIDLFITSTVVDSRS